MSFTDDDLKILKSNIKYWGAKAQSEPGHLEALLARLEAAEKVCELQESNRWGDWSEEMKAWFSAKGK